MTAADDFAALANSVQFTFNTPDGPVNLTLPQAIQVVANRLFQLENRVTNNLSDLETRVNARMDDQRSAVIAQLRDGAQQLHGLQQAVKLLRQAVNQIRRR